MCSIGGIFDNNGLDRKNILFLNKAVKHRGPDDEGYAVFGKGSVTCLAGDDTQSGTGYDLAYFPKEHINNFDLQNSFFALCQRRLSIVDISAHGHQPMCSLNSKLWISYNGEIYNYKAVRNTLTLKGFEFRTSTDTEVILAAYQFWGEQCVHHLNGMWAFVIYDESESKIFISRDRFGIKPFYYTKTEACFTFGSEIKQLFYNHKGQENLESVYTYLSVGIKNYSENTMFNGVLQLGAGCNMIISINSDFKIDISSLKINKWYNLEISERQDLLSFNEATRKFKDLFSEAVCEHFTSEVSIGSCLSGGLDSSSIVSTIANVDAFEKKGNRQLSFSARSLNEQLDEGKWMQKVSSAYPSISSQYVFPEESELLEIFSKITWHQDEPFQSTSVFAQWKVFELAKQNNIKVMIDGQGSDEYLCGYDKFIGPFMLEALKNGKLFEFINQLKEFKVNRNIGFSKIFKHIINNTLPLRYKNSLRGLLNYSSLEPSWLNTEFCSIYKYNNFNSVFKSFDNVKELSENLLFKTNLPILLQSEDRNSMAHSIEARVPFLDHRLVEFGYNLPSNFKIRNGFSKYILRASMEGIIPNDIAFRKDKIGFETAEESWVRTTLRESFLQTFNEGLNGKDGIINNELLTSFKKFLNGEMPYQPYFFRVYNYYQWKKVFNLK